jgi:hypothetical protein
MVHYQAGFIHGMLCLAVMVAAATGCYLYLAGGLS